MDEPIRSSHFKINKATILVIILVVIAGSVGWMLGKSGTYGSNDKPESTEPTATSNSSGPDVKTVVTYRLPDGWEEATCPTAAGSIFVIPAGARQLDCDANPSSPVKISIDSANNTDCNQLQSVQNVSKHVCISEFINGMKGLKAETRYNEQSSYKQDTTIHAYYINTGKDVVKVEYVYTSDNAYQAGWEQLAKSVKLKN